MRIQHVVCGCFALFLLGAMASMPSGVYIYRLEGGGEVAERRMLHLH